MKGSIPRMPEGVTFGCEWSCRCRNQGRPTRDSQIGRVQSQFQQFLKSQSGPSSPLALNIFYITQAIETAASSSLKGEAKVGWGGPGGWTGQGGFLKHIS